MANARFATFRSSIARHRDGIERALSTLLIGLAAVVGLIALAWAVLYNAAALPFAALGWVPPWLAALGMALSSLLVTVNALRLLRVDA